MKASNIVLYSAVRNYGQMIDKITFTADEAAALTAADFDVVDCYDDLSAKHAIDGVEDVCVNGNEVTIVTSPFLYRIDFKIVGKNAAAGVVISKETAEKTEVLHADWFTYHEMMEVKYRLYSPARQSGPRPLVLFLHGAGGTGYDNEIQLTDTIGAIKLAERCPDMYVMAPQAPLGKTQPDPVFKNRFKVILSAETDNTDDGRGWRRGYLGKIADIIREMIADGKVDAKRVYVMGMSMGGCGTIKMCAVAPDLFAAAIPICPSMNGETWPILCNFPKIPVHVATAYIDHAPDRHAHIQRAMQKLWKEGRTDAFYTIYTEDELAAFGIGTTEGLTTKELYAENHNSWILVMRNQDGILDWMFSHVKAL